MEIIYQSNRYKIYSVPVVQSFTKSDHVRINAEQNAFLYFQKYALGEHIKIKKLPSGRPVLEGSDQHISISHSKKRLVVQVSSVPCPGIDTELFRQKLLQVAPRFLSKEEIKGCEQDNKLKLLCLHWCAKEAIYKSADLPGLSFANHISIRNINFQNELTGVIHANLDAPSITRIYELKFILPSSDEAIVFVDNFI